MHQYRQRLAVLACVIGLASTAASAAPPPSPEDVVRAYADAASRRDVEALLALYAPDVRKYAFPGTLSSEGREGNRAKYVKNFRENPKLNVQILSITALGDKVVSHDRVTGLASGMAAEEIVVYQVKDGQITSIMYIERNLR